MRPVVALLACLSITALSPVFADPPAASSTAPAAASPAPAAQPAIDPDLQHFLDEGYKPEMRGGKEVYCHKVTEIGTRVGSKTICGTIAELKAREQRTQNDVHQSQGR